MSKESIGGSCPLSCQFEIRDAMWHCHVSIKEDS